jgi:hypothetical protein
VGRRKSLRGGGRKQQHAPAMGRRGERGRLGKRGRSSHTGVVNLLASTNSTWRSGGLVRQRQFSSGPIGRRRVVPQHIPETGSRERRSEVT